MFIIRVKHNGYSVAHELGLRYDTKEAAQKGLDWLNAVAGDKRDMFIAHLKGRPAGSVNKENLPPVKRPSSVPPPITREEFMEKVTHMVQSPQPIVSKEEFVEEVGKMVASMLPSPLPEEVILTEGQFAQLLAGVKKTESGEYKMNISGLQGESVKAVG